MHEKGAGMEYVSARVSLAGYGRSRAFHESPPNKLMDRTAASVPLTVLGPLAQGGQC